MDLSAGFRPDMPSGAETDAATRLLAFGWAALAGGRAEALELCLRDGSRIEGVLALRIEGLIVEASTRAGAWTHAFRADDVVLVRAVARGETAQRP
jgi:hypothetical protein